MVFVTALVAIVAGCGSVLINSMRPSSSEDASATKAESITTTAATISGGDASVPAPSGPTDSPPPSLATNCSVDVSKPLQSWLASLPADQSVIVPPGTCYLVDEGIKLKFPQDLTIYGGSYMDETNTPGLGRSGLGRAVFTVLGGNGLTLEAMHIMGVNPGGYHPKLAFAAGIELEGTAHATIRGVTISHTYGDGITLDPLRGGANHNSGTIVAPSSAVTIEKVTVQVAGRQGIAFVSVAGAQVDDVIVQKTGFTTFDFEADQPNEGARDVTIDGCEASGGLLFFANGGAGSGHRTGPVTVEGCTMLGVEGGSAVLVARPGHGPLLRGPFFFVHDRLRCGASDYVSCIQLSGARVTISDSTLAFPRGSPPEPVYDVGGSSRVTFRGDVVDGYGRRGQSGAKSTVSVIGGHWTPKG
jgi:hypothetical protein